MDIALLTLRYVPHLGTFDDGPLRALTRDRELLTFREHFFVVQDQPHLLCIIASRPRVAGHRPVPAPEPAKRRHPGQPRPDKPPQSGDYPEGLSKHERQLYDEIRRWRVGAAERAGVPRYVVLTNRDLDVLVRNRPETLTALRKLPGIGKAKVDNYGETLLGFLHPKPEQDAPVVEPNEASS